MIDLEVVLANVFVLEDLINDVFGWTREILVYNIMFLLNYKDTVCCMIDKTNVGAKKNNSFEVSFSRILKQSTPFVWHLVVMTIPSKLITYLFDTWWFYWRD